MKKLIYFVLLLISVQSFGQFTRFYSHNEYLGIWADSISNIANRDTVANPYKIGETRFRVADSTVYIAINITTRPFWMKLKGYVPTGIGTGTVQSVGATFPSSTAISVTGSPVTGTGTLSFTWQGDGTDVVLGNGSYTPYSALITSVTDPLYSPIGHTHFSSEILDLTPVVRNMFSGDSNINVNNVTGAITFTGVTSGGGANNYPTTLSFANNRLSIGRNGLTTLVADWDSSIYHSMGYYDGHYLTANQTISFAPTGDVTGSTTGSTSLTPALTIGNNKVTDAMLRQSAALSIIGRNANSTGNVADITAVTDHGVLRRAGTTLGFGLLDSTNAPDLHSENYYNTKYGSGTTPSLTQYRLAIGDASNLLSTAAAITGNRALVSDANGVPTHSATTATQIGYLSTTTSDVQTQINSKEASFTETTQEFTGSTSSSITLSNTPKSGKAEMYYLNGIVIKSSNISRTGTSVTLGGFTRESSDVITAKYSY